MINPGRAVAALEGAGLGEGGRCSGLRSPGRGRALRWWSPRRPSACQVNVGARGRPGSSPTSTVQAPHAPWSQPTLSAGEAESGPAGVSTRTSFVGNDKLAGDCPFTVDRRSRSGRGGSALMASGLAIVGRRAAAGSRTAHHPAPVGGPSRRRRSGRLGGEVGDRGRHGLGIPSRAGGSVVGHQPRLGVGAAYGDTARFRGRRPPTPPASGERSKRTGRSSAAGISMRVSRPGPGARVRGRPRTADRPLSARGSPGRRTRDERRPRPGSGPRRSPGRRPAGSRRSVPAAPDPDVADGPPGGGQRRMMLVDQRVGLDASVGDTGAEAQVPIGDRQLGEARETTDRNEPGDLRTVA